MYLAGIFQDIIAALAQLGERQTEDLKAPCSIHGGGIFFHFKWYFENVIELGNAISIPSVFNLLK